MNFSSLDLWAGNYYEVEKAPRQRCRFWQAELSNSTTESYTTLDGYKWIRKGAAVERNPADVLTLLTKLRKGPGKEARLFQCSGYRFNPWSAKKKNFMETSLAVQGLRCHTCNAGGKVQSVVGELRSHIPLGVAKK